VYTLFSLLLRLLCAHITSLSAFAFLAIRLFCASI
jgi:hypothetical protein